MLFSRKYIIGHILVFIIAISCFALSAWQFERLSERKELNTRITSAMKHEHVSLTSVASASITEEQVKAIEYRSVKQRGFFTSKGQVLISGRSYNEDPGYYVATPFIIQTDESPLFKGKDVVYVNRGWIPQALGDDILAGKSAKYIEPTGGYNALRSVTGIIRHNEAKRLFGNDDQIKAGNPISIRLSSEIFSDISGIKTSNLYPFWIQMKKDKPVQVPAVIVNTQPSKYPIVLPNPQLSEGNHLSYAIQWILFALIAIITWCVICFQAQKGNKKKASS